MAIPEILLVPDAFGDKTSVLELDAEGRIATKLSYDELTKAASRVLDGPTSELLHKGDIAVLFMPNSAEFVAVVFALLRRGIIVFPLNPALKSDQISGVLRQVRPAAIIGTEMNVGLLSTASGGEVPVLQSPRLGNDSTKDGTVSIEDFVLALHSGSKNASSARVTNGDAETAINPADPALLLFTSGTTGSQKGVALTHRNLLTSIDIVSKAHHITEQDTCNLITPLFHVSGFCTSMLLTLITGGTLVIQPPGVPSFNFWQHLIQHGVTWFHVVPALLKILLKFPGVGEFKHSEANVLRFMRCSGSPLSDNLLTEAEAVTGKPLLEIYGLTESASGIFCNTLDGNYNRRAGRFPVPRNADLKIVPVEATELSTDLAMLTLENNPEVNNLPPQSQVGELYIRGPNVITEYTHSEASTNASSFDADSFFHTGDLAQRVGQDGNFVQLMGRLKEAINKGGEKINPAEVDDAIIQHGEVLEAACFAAPDEEFGEDICK